MFVFCRRFGYLCNDIDERKPVCNEKTIISANSCNGNNTRCYDG